MGPERKRRQVACSWDYVPGPRVGWDCIKEWCGKEASNGKCWNAQDRMILFPKWCFAVLLQGLTNPHLRVSIIGESWNNITVSTSALPSEFLIPA